MRRSLAGGCPWGSAVIQAVGVVVSDHDVPAIEAVLAAIHEQVAGLPPPLGRLGEQMGAAAAVDAGDDLVDLQGLALGLVFVEAGHTRGEVVAEDHLAP